MLSADSDTAKPAKYLWPHLVEILGKRTLRLQPSTSSGFDLLHHQISICTAQRTKYFYMYELYDLFPDEHGIQSISKMELNH